MSRGPGRRENIASVDLARLPSMSTEELKAIWAARPGRPPAPQRRILITEIARCQVERCGGLDPKTERLLNAAIRAARSGGAEAAGGGDPSEGGVGSAPPRRVISRRQYPVLPPGTRLVREWKGRTYEVTVVENGRGYMFQGKTYRALSVIAREIIGSNCSGPRFFGLLRHVRFPCEKRARQAAAARRKAR